MLAAGAVATTWALNHTDSGGISGFQAGAVMWEFMGHWNNITFPARLVTFEDMLYPQYEDKFKKVICKETWDWLQKQAEDRLKNNLDASSKVKKHWEVIVSGKVPFGYSVGKD